MTATACQPTSPWAAVVNGEVIPASDVDNELETVASSPKIAELENAGLGGTETRNLLQPNGPNTINADYTSQVVSGQIYAALLRQDLASKKLSITDDARKQAEDLHRRQYEDPATWDNLPADYRNYLVDRYASLIVAVNAKNTPEAQHAYYQANADNYKSFCVRHILVLDEQKAKDLRARIVAGEDFAAIAKQESIDNEGPGSSAEKGGDLGCFTTAQLAGLVEEFRLAVANLPTGQVSDPVKTDFGFHLIEVTSATQQSFEEAQPSISEELGDANTYIGGLLDKAKVKVNVRYGEYHPANPPQQPRPSIQPHQPVQLKSGDEEPAATNEDLSGSIPSPS